MTDDIIFRQSVIDLAKLKSWPDWFDDDGWLTDLQSVCIWCTAGQVNLSFRLHKPHWVSTPHGWISAHTNEVPGTNCLIHMGKYALRQGQLENTARGSNCIVVRIFLVGVRWSVLAAPTLDQYTDHRTPNHSLTTNQTWVTPAGAVLSNFSDQFFEFRYIHRRNLLDWVYLVGPTLAHYMGWFVSRWGGVTTAHACTSATRPVPRFSHGNLIYTCMYIIYRQCLYIIYLYYSFVKNIFAG